MNVVKRINEQVQRLPEQTQAEVLNFVEYLLAKTDHEDARQEDHDWSQLSLDSAMRGMEDNDLPEYTEADLEERFSAL